MSKTILNVAVAALVLGGCAGETETAISYANDVAPILEEHCLGCHGPGGTGAEATGLVMTSHADLMQGTQYGPVVVPGESMTSVLYQVMSGENVDPSIQMPHGGEPLPADAIATIKAWIDQGAKNN